MLVRLTLLKQVFGRFFVKVRSLIRFIWPQPEPPEVRIIQRDPFRITVQEWRTNEELCRTAQGALKDPTVRRMLDTLRNSHLGMYDMPVDLTSDQRSIRAAVIEGFGTALNTFELLAVHQKPQEPIEADFGADNILE